ncbi:MAG: hypothetical protein J6J83_01040 [Oscillospiraceae bacterium]|nr:hypothetical protein [Oscillospiraceae bacterium]
MEDRMYVNETAYRPVRLLGKGKGGYSYLVERDGALFVLKQIHHEPCDYYQFGDKLQSELQDYQRLTALDIPMPRLLDADIPRERILKEYIAGDTVFELVAQDRMQSAYVRQLQAMCRILYAAGLNIDYYPTNFVVQDETLYYIDYECNPYDPQWDFEHWGSRYWQKSEEFLQALQK